MSLTGKQVRELQSLYESVYAPKQLKEDIVLTEEEFEEICECILEEAFDAIVLDEIVKKTIQTAVKNPGLRSRAFDLMKDAASKIFKPTTVKGGITRMAIPTTAAGIEAGTGYKNIRHGGAILKNLRDYIGGTRQMVNKDTEGAGMLQVDKDTGRIDSTKKDKNIKKIQNKYKESFEFEKYNLHIVEDAESLKDLTDKLNKQKNQKDNTNINTNIKKDKDTSNTDAFDYGTDDKGNKRKQPSATDTLKIIDKSNKQAADLEKKELSEPDFDDPNRKINRGGPMPQPVKTDIKKDDKKDDKKDIKKDLDKLTDAGKPEVKKDDKLLSTHIPIVSKTKLGSTVRPVKPGSARDKMIAKNELRHGSDSIVKKRKMNADFQRMKKGEISKMDFMKQYPGSQTTKKYNMKQIDRGKQPIRSQYEPYDFVLDYVLSEGHASTLEEAHYVMMQMNQDTIQSIVSEYENV